MPVEREEYLMTPMVIRAALVALMLAVVVAYFVSAHIRSRSRGAAWWGVGSALFMALGFVPPHLPSTIAIVVALGSCLMIWRGVRLDWRSRQRPPKAS